MLFMGIGFVGGDFTLAVATEPANVVLMQIIRRDSLIIAIIILGNDTHNLCKPVHNACVSKHLKIKIVEESSKRFVLPTERVLSINLINIALVMTTFIHFASLIKM